MEVAPLYGSEPVRPRLTVVKDDGAAYSALPHEIMRDTRLSRDARLLYAILQSHWWQGGECWASHATLAAEMGCTDRHLRRFLQELVKAGRITERRRGQGQAKAYRPVDSVSQQDRSVRLNGSDSSASESNRTDLSAQQDRSVLFNRTDLSYRRRSNEEDSLKEEVPVCTAASAAPAQMAEPLKEKSESRAKRLPADWSLTDAHYAAATKRGFDAKRAEAEAEKFSDYHRAKGTRMVDWLAAWRTWLGNAVTFDARRSPAPPARNGHDRVPPGAASKQKSDWSDFKGRYGSNLNPVRRDDGR